MSMADLGPVRLAKKRSAGGDKAESRSEEIRAEISSIKALIGQAFDRIQGLEAQLLRTKSGEKEDWGPNEELRRQAVSREQERFVELRQKGALIRAQELAQLRKVGRSAVSEAFKARRLFRVRVGREELYPSFFATHDADQQDIERVCQELGSLPGSVKLNFFRTPLGPLGNLSPLDALARGKIELVLKAARAALEL